MDYAIKQVPEDFVVKESMEPEIGAGRFAYYLLSKRGWATQSAIEQISRALGKRTKYFNFSGNKDKQAITEQHISVLHGPKRDLELQGGEIRLEYLGQARQRINLGAALGNEFEITVRNLEPGFRPRPVKQFPNYFDVQRFGKNLNNHEVGKCLIKRDFPGACRLIPEVQERLSHSPNDYVGALRGLPRRVLRLYAHSYQSWLWNQAASLYLGVFPHRTVSWPLGELTIPEKPVKNMGFPIPGYNIEIPPESRTIIQQIITKEGITLEDFRIKQFQEFDLGGSLRDLMAEPRGLEISGLKQDELNPGRMSCTVKFFLQSGSYATMAIRLIFS